MKRYLMVCTTAQTYYIAEKYQAHQGYACVMSNKDPQAFDDAVYDLRCEGYTQEEAL